MMPNDEGFLMPVVDKEKCVQCGMCDKSCPHLQIAAGSGQHSFQDFKDRKAYLYYSNEEARKESASGGFVYDLNSLVVARGGYAAGCIWDDEVVARHIVSNEQRDLQRMQSSKYVQSDMSDCYSEVRKLLKEGREVVFCGTPCQTAGLHQFLGKTDRTNLISVCLICHGVPSPAVWERYKKILEQKYHGKMIDVNMRDKSYKGYSTSYVRYTFDCPPARGGRDSDPRTSQNTRNVGMPTYLADPYLFLFTDDLYLRNNCTHCAYKGDGNKADIIVGDFYESTPGAGNLGCSCTIAMTEKGEHVMQQMQGSIIECPILTVGSVNNMLWKSVKKHPRRDEFFSLYKRGVESSDLFSQFLPLRFKVKRRLNQLGVFNAYLSLKRRVIHLCARESSPES